MAKCKPVTLNQLVGGQHYISVQVALNGSMWLETFVFCGKPARGEYNLGLKILGKRLNEKTDLFLHFDMYASGVGLLPQGRYNEHRIFRYTAKNHAILRDLVDRRALVEYLGLIGIEDPTATIAKNFADLQEIDELERLYA